MTERICVARIGAAHGVRGEVKLWSFTENPAAVATYGPLETEDGKQRFEIEAMNPEHRAAQKKAREIYYSEYSVQVCNVVRESKFKLEYGAV